MKLGTKVTLASLAVVPFALLYFKGEDFLKEQIEKRYDVKIGTLDVRFVSVDLWGVSVKRKNIEAFAKYVHVEDGKPYFISNGYINITGPLSDDKPPSDKQSKSNKSDFLKKIEAEGFTINASNLTSLNDKTVATGVNLNDGKLHIDKVDSSISDIKTVLTNISANAIKRDDIRIEKAESEVKIPFELPFIEREYKLVVRDVKASTKDKEGRADSLAFGPFNLHNVIIGDADDSVWWRAKKVNLKHPWLAKNDGILTVNHVGGFAPKPNESMGNFLLAIGLEPNTVQLKVDPDNYSINGEGACIDWINALPKPLPVFLDISKESFSGRFSIDISVKPEPKFKLNNRCDFTCTSRPIKGKDSIYSPDNTINYIIYDENGLPAGDRTIYRGDLKQAAIDKAPFFNDIMVPIDMIPLHVVDAFVSLEDEYYFKHEGVMSSAIQNSLIANLKLGRFFRGGSTITMQLAKNLWLNRDKTLLRKIHEIFLTTPLEKCLTKEQIIELYLNVIEFGPNIYGIRDAADYYFGLKVHELSEVQAYYLAMILPNPKKALAPNHGGLDKARSLMIEHKMYRDKFSAKAEDEGMME